MKNLLFSFIRVIFVTYFLMILVFFKSPLGVGGFLPHPLFLFEIFGSK